MAISFHAGINLGKNELQNARVQNLANSAQPSSPVAGQIYFDTDNSELTIYNGSAWEGVGAYTLPTATASVLGGVKIDNSTIGISSGVISVKDSGITNAKISASADIALSKLADIADDRILGNVSGSAGAPAAMTAAQVRTMINVANGATANAGTVTSVTGGTGLSGSISSSGSLSVDYSGTDNIILSATDGTGLGTLEGNDKIAYVDADNAVKYADVSQLPFSNNAGTVTSVTGGSGLTGSVSSTGSLAVGAGTGITVNADDVAVTAAQTGITSVLNASLKVGRDADNDIDFSTDNEIVFRANGADQIKLQDGAIVPITDNDIDLGTSTLEFKNAYFDGVVTSDSFVGNLTGTASSASTIAVDANTDNSAYEIVFQTSNALKKDGSASDKMTYNPSTQTLSVKNITVSGTQTINNEQLINTSNGIIFEGATADANETTLIATDPTKDNTVTLADLSGHVALFASAPTATISATPAELNYVDGVTSNIQTQLNAKQATVTGAATTITGSNLTTNRALVSNGSGKVAVSAVTSTELGYLDGVTSAIQTQLNTKGTMSSFVLEDGDGTEVTISHGKEVKFVEGGGIDINWTDTSNGSDADPYDLTFSVTTATASAKGIAELATAAEVQAGTDTTRIVTPDTLASRSVHATIDVSDTNFASNLYAEVRHNLGTEDVIVQCFDSSTKETVYADVARTTKDGTASTNYCLISFGRAPSNDIEVMVTSIKGSTSATVAYA